MKPFIDLLGEKLYRGQMEVELFAKGGAKLHHERQQLHEARGCDIMVLMVGGMTFHQEQENITSRDIMT